MAPTRAAALGLLNTGATATTAIRSQIKIRATVRMTVGAMGLDAVLAPTASLLLSVLDVLGVRPQEEMIWPDAGRIVAEVADGYSIGDHAVVKLPRHAMGPQQDAMLAATSDLPIAALYSPSPHPEPAIRCLLDFRPETFDQCAAPPPTVLDFQRQGELCRMRMHREPLFSVPCDRTANTVAVAFILARKGNRGK
jgi:hypothetical protein